MIYTPASVYGGAYFSMYGSNDNNTWETINTFLACKSGTEGTWYNEPMTSHITRIDNGNYDIPAYQYIKLVITPPTYGTYCCIGVQKFYK